MLAGVKPTRLDKLLANRGYCSRSHAAGFVKRIDIREGERRILKPDEKVEPAKLTIDGQPIDPETILIVLNKPAGYVCSRSDAGTMIYELLPERFNARNPAITTVGRLDKETTGLILLSDEGLLVHRLTSPKHHVPRTYLATLQHPLCGDEAAVFASGSLTLESDDKPLLPAEMEMIAPTQARLTLREGRYHQIRRMFAAVGNHVVALHRESFGPITLGDLAPGAYRMLSDDERAALTGAA